MRFILDVIAGNIQIMNKKLNEITARLIELNYPPINTGNEDVEELGEKEEKAAEEEIDSNINYKHYNYIYIIQSKLIFIELIVLIGLFA